MKIHPKSSAGEVASALLKSICLELFEIVPASSTINVQDGVRVHSIRSCIKRLRDTILVFERLYGSKARPQLATLTDMQASFGAMHDLWAAKRTLLKRTGGVDLSSVLEGIDREMAARTGDFQEQWNRAFGTTAQRNRWITFFSGPDGGLSK